MVKPTKLKAPRKTLALRPSWRGALTEPSTWAGIATIGSAILTDGVSILTSPAALSQVVAGLSLIALKEVTEAEE